MLTDCKWLLSNLAEGLQRFALMDDETFVAYAKLDRGLFHSIGNGLFNSPYVCIVDDGRVDWGNDRLDELTSELRAIGLLRVGEQLRIDLEALLTEVMRLEHLVSPKLVNADKPYVLADLLGSNLLNAIEDLQSSAEKLLIGVLDVWKKLPADEPVTIGELAGELRKNGKPVDPQQVARELKKVGAPQPIDEIDNSKRPGTKIKRYMRDAALLYFSRLPKWQV